MPNYSKVLDPSDFDAWGIQKRKQWEVEMALRCLRSNGAIRKTSEILGVGAGKEATIYHLSNSVKRVFATDLYLSAGMWSDHAPKMMMMNPSYYSNGIDHNPRRIIVQHADMLRLPYEDNTFNAVFSSGSIEHVGSSTDIRDAVREIVRVVKPGGVISLSTEWRLSGNGNGWDGVFLFDHDTLMEYIVEPSGCEFAGLEPVSEQLMTVEPYPLTSIVAGRRPPVEMVLSFQQYLFTSVHIELIKPKD